jgi:hypothetical protein
MIKSFYSHRGTLGSTVGFVTHEGKSVLQYWSGTLAGKTQFNATTDGIEFRRDEYLFQGVAEIPGMSDGPTANGNGYTGVVHGNHLYKESLLSHARVIPFDSIVRECISQCICSFSG